MKKHTHLAIIDTGSALSVMDVHLKTTHILEEDYPAYIAACLSWYNRMGFFPMLADRDDVVVIWALDNKPYWRSKVHPRYKAQRKPDPLSRKSQMLDILHGQGFYTLGHSTYEADDIAALYGSIWACRRPDSSFKHMYFCTPDKDWSGLLRSDDQLVLDIGGHAPRVRDAEIAYGVYVSDRKKASKKRQKSFPLVPWEDWDSSDIWKWKAHVGDASDNLLVDSPLSIIDLYNPPTEYNLILSPEKRNEAISLINSYRVNPDWATAEQAEELFVRLGTRNPITYIQEDDYYAATNVNEFSDWRND